MLLTTALLAVGVAVSFLGSAYLASKSYFLHARFSGSLHKLLYWFSVCVIAIGALEVAFLATLLSMQHAMNATLVSALVLLVAASIVAGSKLLQAVEEATDVFTYRLGERKVTQVIADAFSNKEAAPAITKNSKIILVLAAAVPIFAYWLAATTYLVWASPWMHAAIEFISVLVGVAVAACLLKTFMKEGLHGKLWIAAAFCWMAALDLLHALTFQGMDLGLFLNSPNAALGATNLQLWFWIPSRVIGSLLLAAGAAAILIQRRATPLHTRRNKVAVTLLVVAVAIAAAVYVVNSVSLPALFIPGTGLTQTKIILEASFIVLTAAAALLLLKRFLKTHNPTLALLITALTWLASSSIAFLLYKDPFDSFVWIGHALKLVSYGLLTLILFKVNFEEQCL